MQIYTGGQVSAKVVLDTKEFDSAIERVAERMKSFQSSLKDSSAADFSSKISDLEKRLKSAETTITNLKNRIEDYKTKLNDLRNGHKQAEESFKGVATQSKQYNEQLKRLANTLKDYRVNTAEANQASAQYKSSLMGLSRALRTYNTETNRFKAESQQGIRTMSLWAVENEKVTNSFEKQQKFIQYIHTGYNRLTNSMVRTTEVLKTFNFALLDGIDKETIFYRRTVQLASAMQRMNSQGTANWAGRGQFGYSQYVSQISRLNEAMTRQKQIESSIKAQKLDQYYAKVGSASAKYWNQIRQGTINLNTYKSQMNQINSILNQQTSRTQKLASAQHRLFQQYHTTNLNTYKANMSQINAQLEKQQANFSKTETNARNAGRGITSFNNGVVQTAHSGRILSNTLYQIRGALLSLKMIFTAMGGMALWGFASSIAEGVKETLTAKNEMEAQLRQNTKVGEGGIAYFNKQLEETTKLFPKINKYSIGETVSAIGLEFNLNAKQMAESLDIVSMVQSEYVRAGRKEAEAALAVKDILQGEFSRLSRETGVGKEELIAYGWNGKKDDVESLMKALRKAAKDRHWDVFAAKATSLNDVMTILKSRFSETGADILNSATPLIVGAFNTIIGGVDKIEKAFNGLNSFWQNFTLLGGALSGILAIGTALPMISKGMGLADIATLGWGKSLLTAALNLNKAEVAQYGFRKALAAVISGTSASELANRRATSAILGRILGVNQAVQAEQGLMGALVHSRMTLKGVTMDAEASAVVMGNLRQKIIYLAKGEIVADKASATWGKTLKSLVTSTKLLKIALAGVMAIGIIAWLSSIASWCDKVKGYVDGFNDVAENGKQILKDAESTVSDYEQSLSKLTKGTDEYARAEANLAQAKANRDDIEKANELVKVYKKQNEETEKEIKLRHQSALKDSYVLAGKNYKEATELASGYQSKVRVGQYYINKSLEVYDDRLYKASQHMNEHVKQLQDAGLKGDALTRYIDEYNVEAENAAELWKKFNQGDMASGAYAMLSELKLAWIDISNHPEVVKLFQNLAETWEGLQPTLKSITEDLKWLGLRLVDLGNFILSNDLGKAVVTWGAFGTVIGAVALKIGKWVTGSKSTFDVLKKIGSKLKDRITDWRNYGDEAEKANKKAGGGVTSTGGINGDVTKSGGSFKEQLGTQLKADAAKYARAAVAIAAGMLLITEAIVLLRAPMGALAELGWQYKQWEPEIKKGIEGLQLIAPTILAFLVPITALTLILGRYAPSFTTMIKGGLSAATGIAIGMLLVAEAIFMLKAPMWSLTQVGKDYAVGKKDIEGGITAIKTLTEALEAMLPVVPIFLAGIALGVTIFMAPEIGLLIAGGAAVGIATGMLLVAEAVVTLRIPLEAIRELGNSFTDIEGAKKGAEALRVTAEAMTYVEQGVRAMTLVQWELIASNIADVVAQLMGHNLGEDLVKLTEENGFLDQLNKFAVAFNNKEFTAVSPEKATALQTAADSLTALNTALESAKNAIANLPAEFKNGGNGEPLLSYDATTDTTAVTGSADTEGYFDQLKQPIEDLAKFMDWFNGIEITAPKEDKVTALTSSATMVEQINNAVEKVKNTMGNIAMGNIATNIAQTTDGGGWGMLAALNPFSALGTSAAGGGTGDYKSSVGSQLYEMEMVLTDLSTFNSKIAGIGGGNGGGAFTEGSGGNAEALTGMVTAVSDAINQLSSTLSQAVPTITQNAKNIGSGISNGVKEGMGNLTTLVIPPFTTAMNTMKAYATTYGKGVGDKLTQGFKEGMKIAQATGSEILTTLTYLDGKKQDFYDKGAALGDSLSRGYQDHKGLDHHSPGRLARATFEETGYILQAFDEAMMVIPAKAAELGDAISTNYTPQLATNIGLTDMSTYESGLSSLGTAAMATDIQTSTAFNNMNTTVSTDMTGITGSVTGAFNTIKQNTTTSYAQITNTTRTSLNNMQSQTTKNIQGIRTSWKGMQTALIQSAENIRSQTSQKIRQLESNMASFWRKVQNPANLLGAAGNPFGAQHTIKRRSNPARLPKGVGFAGRGSKNMGISSRFKAKPTKADPTMFAKLFEVIGSNIPLFAGGWSFNWSKDIQNALLKWHTHFGEIYDKHLTVGKFENDDFPVRGIAEIAKNYIYDAISRTHYVGYFNSRYGDDPLAAWNAGGFNCWDGANVVLALASAFGFNGGYKVHGSWDGTPHVWARIPGLGDIDATAIQGGYGFTASKVKGAGSIKSSNAGGDIGTTHNYNGDINIHIHTDGNNVEVDDNRIDNETGRKIIDLLGINPATGR